MRVTIKFYYTSGRRTSWMKHVTDVDLSKTDGYAFKGAFLQEGETDLPEGAIIIEKVPEGSVKNAYHTARIYKVTSQSELWDITPRTWDWRKNFLSIRDFVAEQLRIKNNPLEVIETQTLIDELYRRGYNVSSI